MLEKLRRGATKVVVFVLFTILVLSFAVWGIGDIVRQSPADGPVARVGDVQITAQDFQNALLNRRQTLSQQFGRTITPEQSRAFGLDNTVLSELINGAAVSQSAEKMGLRVSDATLAEGVRNDALFQGPNKQFSRELFNERVRQAGLNETAYFADRKQALLREQLTETLIDGVAAPALLVDILHTFRGESRTVQSVTIDPAKLPPPADPDDAKLKEHYEASKRQFVQPEMRQFAVLILSPDDVTARATVDDAEVKAAWDKDPAAANIPERRRVQQIVFNSRAEAETAAKEIAEGKSFLIAALEANGAQGRVDQGLITRREVPDANLAAAIFSLAPGQLSQPIDVRGKTFLARVSEIEPGRTRSFEEVAPEITENLQQTRQREFTTKLRDQIEDLRGAGKSLADIAAEMKLSVRQVAAADKTGKGPDGKAALDLPDAQKIVGAAFESQRGVPHDAVELSEGREAWVELLGVTPEKQKPIEEVRDEVKALWITAEMRKAASAAADAIVERVRKGETLEAVAKEQGLTVATSEPIKRTDTPAVLSQAATRQAFTLAKGDIASAESVDGKSRTVFMVTEITKPAPPTKEETERLVQDLNRQRQDVVLSTFVTTVRERSGLTINEAAYRRATGLERHP